MPRDGLGRKACGCYPPARDEAKPQAFGGGRGPGVARTHGPCSAVLRIKST